MKTIKRRILMAFMVLVGLQVQAQGSFDLSGPQEFKVSGTSTLHDWDMIANEGVKGNMKASINGSDIQGISSLIITLPVSTLKSGKSTMDNKAYEALNIKSNPNIHYELTEVEEIGDGKIKAKGRLTIAGHSKLIAMNVGYKVNNGVVTFTGEQPITFKEFNVDPPTAVFNTIKTGNELKIAFSAQFKSTR